VVTEPSNKPHLVGPVEARIHPEQLVFADIAPGLRVNSSDYGAGTVVAVVATGVQVYWDKSLAGTDTHLLTHDTGYVARLERL
jgi:hypothetical protein